MQVGCGRESLKVFILEFLICDKVGGWQQSPMTRKAQEALHLWQVIINVLLVQQMAVL